MESLFTNKCTYTKPNLLEISRVTTLSKLQTILFTCMGLILIFFGLFTANYICCLVGVLLCSSYPLLFWVARHSATTRYQQLQQLYNSEVESVTSFYEDRLIVHNVQDGSDVTIAYSQVAKVYETKNLFFLMLSTRIGFMLEKQGFERTTADEFGKFIRARAVGEGQKDLKKKKRKKARTVAIVYLVILAFSITFILLATEKIIPETFTYGNYSIELTSAFDGYDGEWYNPDVTVYCFYETSEELSSNGSSYDTAAAYLKDTNEYYGINSVVTAISDDCAWTAYTDIYDEIEYYNYDYVIESDGGFWYTEFYCQAKDIDKYELLFQKWAQTIAVTLPL